MTAAAAAAAASQELPKSGKSPDPSRPGTKYPVQGIPHFDLGVFCTALQKERRRVLRQQQHDVVNSYMSFSLTFVHMNLHLLKDERFTCLCRVDTSQTVK